MEGIGFTIPRRDSRSNVLLAVNFWRVDLCMEQFTMFPPREHGVRVSPSGQTPGGVRSSQRVGNEDNTRPSHRQTTKRNTLVHPTNHVGIFLGYADGKITILDQSTGRPLTIEENDAAGWNVVKVPNSKDGPYEDASTQSYMKATRSPADLAAIQRYGRGHRKTRLR